MALLLWQVSQIGLAESHVSDSVERVLQERPTVDVVVTLPFTPEQFHSDFFTDCCSIARVEGRSFYLVGVAKSDVRHIGEQYWVSRVDVWDKSGDDA